MFQRFLDLLHDDGADGDLAIVGLGLFILSSILVLGVIYFMAKAIF